MSHPSTATPMFKQYQSIKSLYKDCILFFRLGDFYEMFYEDAKEGARLLELVLTSRGKGTSHPIPMCGVPYHAAESYIAKLIKAGKKVAICEQTEDPALAKTLVKRDVIRVITSGTFLDEHSTESRYLLCLNLLPYSIGLAFTDTTTGLIQTNQYEQIHKVVEIISRLPIYECLYPMAQKDLIQKIFSHPLLKTKEITLSPHEDWCFNPDIADKTLCEHFAVMNLKGFGLADLPEAIASAGALLEYLKKMHKQPLKHVDKISLYMDEDYMYIAPAATYGLELEQLYHTINLTLTAGGKRMLHFWLYHPLKQPGAILQRQAAVTLLKEERPLKEKLKKSLTTFPDLEKSISKLSCGYTHARDILAIRNALSLGPALQEATASLASKNRLFALEDIADLRLLLEKAVNPEMPLSDPEGRMIKSGFNPKLDDLRAIQENGRQWLRRLQAEEIQKTGISSLKVGYNNVFGYYIEVTKTNLKCVPAHYIRKQTLVNGERFITPDLKEFEEKILTAQEKILKIEQEILEYLKKEILDHSPRLHQFCHSVATLDCLYSLSRLAQGNGYCAPALNDETIIDIKEGRHPVVEKTLAETFTVNDSYLDGEDHHLIILTGPNMAGKSTYIRQNALLVILAQMGSYIPATSAKIGIVDKVFTRIGAHDEIAKGQSTFMVEMTEAADILHNLTSRSLIILDEIGRGTSTYDGLSLAWAIAEHLAQTKARTLFATHFHELTALAEAFPGVKNYNVSVKEWRDEIIFLHKIAPGSTDDSYGIYVAKLAGIPREVIARSKQILSQLELKENLKEKLASAQSPETQFSFFTNPPDPRWEKIKSRLASLNVNTLTPLGALNQVQALKELLGEED